MIFIALDIATATGVAVGDPTGEPTFFTEKLGAGSQGSRFAGMMLLVRRLIKDHQPNLIAIERIMAQGGGGGQSRAELAGGLRGVVLCSAFVSNSRVREFYVATIRKHFIGEGRLKRKEAKERTINECQMRGWQVENDNEADALALWDLIGCKYGGRRTMSSGALADRW